MPALDPVLETIAQLAERGLSMTATATVQGTVISGRIIGQQRYVLGIRQRFNAQIHEENLPGLSDILQLFEDAVKDENGTFLHFEDAMQHTGSLTQPKVLGLWRVRISAIDGFSFGA